MTVRHTCSHRFLLTPQLPNQQDPHPHPHRATYKSIDIPPIWLNNSTQNDDEISTSPRGLGILYKTRLAEDCLNLKMAVIGRKVKFILANKHHHLAIFYSCVFTEFTSPYSLNAQRGWHTSDGTPQMAHLRWHTSDGTPQNSLFL